MFPTLILKANGHRAKSFQNLPENFSLKTEKRLEIFRKPVDTLIIISVELCKVGFFGLLSVSLGLCAKFLAIWTNSMHF